LKERGIQCDEKISALVDRGKTEDSLILIASHAEMSAVLAVIAVSGTTFAATNIDDLFLLAVFCAKRVPMRRVMAGQFLGFAGIVAISLIGLWPVLTIPRGWFRVLGLLPLALGIKHLFHMHKNGGQPAGKFKVLAIAGITLTNGADNIGIYVPFFAISRSYLWMILSTYAVLLPVWCFCGKWLGERPVALRFIDHYGHWVVPIVFIGLGTYILIWQ
jgi:cadmium resistance protein CadD (predicted permease)